MIFFDLCAIVCLCIGAYAMRQGTKRTTFAFGLLQDAQRARAQAYAERMIVVGYLHAREPPHAVELAKERLS